MTEGHVYNNGVIPAWTILGFSKSISRYTTNKPKHITDFFFKHGLSNLNGQPEKIILTLLNY